MKSIKKTLLTISLSNFLITSNFISSADVKNLHHNLMNQIMVHRDSVTLTDSIINICNPKKNEITIENVLSNLYSAVFNTNFNKFSNLTKEQILNVINQSKNRFYVERDYLQPTIELNGNNPINLEWRVQQKGLDAALFSLDDAITNKQITKDTAAAMVHKIAFDNKIKKDAIQQFQNRNGIPTPLQEQWETEIRMATYIGTATAGAALGYYACKTNFFGLLDS